MKSEENLMEQPITWLKFKESYFKEYFLSSVRQQMQREFYALQKGSKTLTEYERELNRLMKFAPNAFKHDEEARM